MKDPQSLTSNVIAMDLNTYVNAKFHFYLFNLG